MKELDRERPMRAIHRKTGEVGYVVENIESKALTVGNAEGSREYYFDRYGNPKDDFCPWRVENVPDVVDWSKPIEAVHDSGIVKPAELLSPRTGFIEFCEVKYGNLASETRWFAKDGSGGDSGWRIRNVQSYTEAVMELSSKISSDAASRAAEMAQPDTTPVDKALWERVVGLVRHMAGNSSIGRPFQDGEAVTYSSGHYTEARAIAELLGPVVDADLIEAREAVCESHHDKHPESPWHIEQAKAVRAGERDNMLEMLAALAAIKRVRKMEELK